MKSTLLVLISVWLLAAPCSAQELPRAQAISVGVKVHERFTDSLTAISGLYVLGPPPNKFGNYTLAGTLFTASPTIEIGIPAGLAISLESFRHRMSYQNFWQSVDLTASTRTFFQSNTAGHAWEFPIMLKKYIDTGANVLVYPEGGLTS